MNSHLLPLFISHRSSGEKLIKYQESSSCVIMFLILMTTLFYKALILQGDIWCWSLLGLKELRGHHWHDNRYSWGAHLCLCCFKNYCHSLILMKSGLNFNTKLKITSHNIGQEADMNFQSANSFLFLADFLLKLRKKMQPLLCLTLHIAGITP